LKKGNWLWKEPSTIIDQSYLANMAIINAIINASDESLLLKLARTGQEQAFIKTLEMLAKCIE
jgi:hypothetical protein